MWTRNGCDAKIAIVGVGQVGGAAAYAIILSAIASELLLVDNNIDRRDGQVRDLSDVAYCCNSGTEVRAATYEEAGQCDFIVLTLACRHALGETNIEQIYRNVSLVRNVVQAMVPFSPDSILLVVSNPVDLLTSVALGVSGLPPEQVFGSGTLLDSVRLRGILADELEIATNSIDVYILGVHGESEVVAWSIATIAGIPLAECTSRVTRELRADLEEECKSRSQVIIRAKGSTPFGIGSIISGVCSSVLLNRRNVLPISHFQTESGCCISLPAVLGSKGIIKTVSMPLAGEERLKLVESAKTLREMVDHVEGRD